MSASTVLDAALDSGLSGPGRLHDLMVTVDAATPGQISREGQGMEIHYGTHDSPFGACLLAQTTRGVCGLEFLPDPISLPARKSAAAEAWCRQRWPRARWIEDQAATAATLSRILEGLDDPARRPPLDIQGSNFQLRVWDALMRLPTERLISYGSLAEIIDRPGASRAVGTAVGANPVPLLIPCHRVLRQSGAFGNYSGGIYRKRAILVWELGRSRRLGQERVAP